MANNQTTHIDICKTRDTEIEAITGHKGARSLITKVERDELLEVVFRKYLADK